MISFDKQHDGHSRVLMGGKKTALFVTLDKDTCEATLAQKSDYGFEKVGSFDSLHACKLGLQAVIVALGQTEQAV